MAWIRNVLARRSAKGARAPPLGREHEVLAATGAELDARVRCLVVATRSCKLDGDVLALLHGRCWVLENEKPTRFRYDAAAPTLESMAEMDGTQVWRNPRLDR